MRTWLSENIKRVVGNGSSTLFWNDWWVGENHLCDSFRRLFELSENKVMTVGDKFILG